jgi:hypothetical protein
MGGRRKELGTLELLYIGYLAIYIGICWGLLPWPKGWHISHKAWNKLMHAIHGNGSPGGASAATRRRREERETAEGHEPQQDAQMTMVITMMQNMMTMLIQLMGKGNFTKQIDWTGTGMQPIQDDMGGRGRSPAGGNSGAAKSAKQRNRSPSPGGAAVSWGNAVVEEVASYTDKGADAPWSNVMSKTQQK